MKEPRSRRPLPGLLLAGIAALVSGVSVFVNAYGVHAIKNAALYTTAKNLVATVLIAGFALASSVLSHDATMPSRAPTAPRGDDNLGLTGRAFLLRSLAIAYVGVVGGGVAFVMFFNGLSRAGAEPSAFLHDTLVLWVGLLAWPVLRERVTVWNVAALALLVGGQTLLGGGVGDLLALDGAALVLGATVLWSIEVVVVKRLLCSLHPQQLATIRMSVGSAVLVGYLALTGNLAALTHLGRDQVGWVLLTGALLATYVTTWFFALGRARALDVTSVLVGSAVVTALLQAAAGRSLVAPQLIGATLIAVGTTAVLAGRPKRVAA